MKTFKVTLLVTSTNLANVLVHAQQVLTIAPVIAEEKTSRFVNGARNKGVKGEDLLLKTLAIPHTPAEIADAFEAAGFARNSASPILSRLVAAKKIKRSDAGVYTLVKR